MKLNKKNIVANIIEENIDDENKVFVFPTQISVDMWADWTVTNTKTKAVPMERFKAWDDFKGESIRSTHQDKKSIPGTMRSIFAADLIKKNSQEKFLSYLITKEYAQSASGFTDWIAGVLPSLALWKKRIDDHKPELDSEYNDYMEIYNRYKTFLDSHNLFDPAWETPPFDSKGKSYIIFFPEILMDYLEYKEILENSGDTITLISIPVNENQGDYKKPDGNFYPNSRTELRQACLQLKKIHEEKNIPWQDMALSTFDLENWGPYIERELDLYEIPHILKNGKPLSSTAAGNLFSQIQNCVSENFSYDSVKNLLLNTAIPWYDFDLNQRLIKFGKENNCICSFTITDENGNPVEEYDVWEASFDSPIKKEIVDEIMKRLYRNLKKLSKDLVHSKTFEELRTNYFKFREQFFEVEKFTPQSNNIISRCISELCGLIDLEKDFPDCSVPNHYGFFVDLLGNKNYVPQTTEQGVQVLPYRLSSTAPFLYQVVLDSTQASTSIVYRQMGFLNEEKRRSLGFSEESNVTGHFINLYNIHSADLGDIPGTLFSASSKSFSGYGLLSSYLNLKSYIPSEKKKFEISKLDDADTFLNEKAAFISSDKNIKQLTSIQHNGFESWKKMQDLEKDAKPTDDAVKKIHTLVDENLKRDGKITITYSALRKFYEDPHAFFSSWVLDLEEDGNEADLTPKFMIGNLKHKILELYCKSLMQKNLPLTVGDDCSLTEDYYEILLETINQAILEFDASSLSKQLLETTKQSIIEEIKVAIENFSIQFKNYKVHEVEKSYSFYPEDKNYYFYGKMDCILKHPSDNHFILVDFKSSEGAVHNEIFYVSDDVLIPDFQMPIYKYLLENQNPPINVTDCCFYSISNSKFFPVIGKYLEPKVPKNYDGLPTEQKFESTTEAFLSLADFYAEKVSSYEIDQDDVVEQWISKNQINIEENTQADGE